MVGIRSSHRLTRAVAPVPGHRGRTNARSACRPRSARCGSAWSRTPCRWAASQELADVAAVHDDPRDDLVSLTDLIMKIESHRPPKPAEPRDRLLETLRALGAAGRRLVVDELGMHQLVGGLEPALLEHLLEHPLGELLVLVRH